MADNVVANAGSGGATFGSDDVGGVHYPRSKLVWGPDGTVNDADVASGKPLPVQIRASAGTDMIGQKAMAASIPVVLASDQAAIPVSDNGGALTVDGTVTVAQATAANLKGQMQITDGTEVASVDASNRLEVAVAAALPAGSNNIGDVDVATIAAGANRIGKITVRNAADSADIDPLAEGTFTTRVPTNGQKAMAGSIPVVLPSDQTSIPVAATLQAGAAKVGAVDLDSDAVPGSAAPGVGQLVCGTDGTNARALKTDSGGELQVDVLSVAAGANRIGKVTVRNAADSADIDPLAETTFTARINTLGAKSSAACTPVVLASDQASIPVAATLQAGTAVAGKVYITDGTEDVSVDASNRLEVAVGNVAEVQGDVAHDAAISGFPLRIGARAGSADYTAVGDGDAADLLCTLNGKLVTSPHSLPENLVSGATAAITDTSNTQVIAAAGAGVRNYVTQILVTNSHATVGTVVEIKDGTTVLYRGYAAEDGGGFSVTLPTPLRGTANTAINAACVTTGSNVYVSCAGFKAP